MVTWPSPQATSAWKSGGMVVGRGGQDVVINSPGARLGGPTLQLAHDTI